MSYMQYCPKCWGEGVNPNHPTLSCRVCKGTGLYRRPLEHPNPHVYVTQGLLYGRFQPITAYVEDCGKVEDGIARATNLKRQITKELQRYDLPHKEHIQQLLNRLNEIIGAHDSTVKQIKPETPVNVIEKLIAYLMTQWPPPNVTVFVEFVGGLSLNNQLLDFEEPLDFEGLKNYAVEFFANQEMLFVEFEQFNHYVAQSAYRSARVTLQAGNKDTLAKHPKKLVFTIDGKRESKD